jgi:hypothetical protein
LDEVTGDNSRVALSSIDGSLFEFDTDIHSPGGHSNNQPEESLEAMQRACCSHLLFFIWPDFAIQKRQTCIQNFHTKCLAHVTFFDPLPIYPLAIESLSGHVLMIISPRDATKQIVPVVYHRNKQRRKKISIQSCARRMPRLPNSILKNRATWEHVGRFGVRGTIAKKQTRE